MSIGNNIYKPRTSKYLSQGELADLLDVSRQSVSKWETDAAVPDLDKLMKLCDEFGVSLDEITGRKTNFEETKNINTSKEKTSSAQKIIGYILFTFSLLLGVVLLIFGHNPGDYIILIPVALSIMVCGLLCLFAGNKAFYWCMWAIFAPITVLTPQLVGFPVLSVLTIILIIVFVIMFFVANAVFKDTIVKIRRKNTILLILAWLIPIWVYGLLYCIYTIPMPSNIAYNTLVSIMINFVLYALVAVLETYTVCYVKNLRKK